MPDAEQYRTRRIATVLITTIVVEVGLVALAHFAPAMRGLIRPVYFIVLLVGAFSFWHAVRPRTGQDRRHGERRRG